MVCVVPSCCCCWLRLVKAILFAHGTACLLPVSYLAHIIYTPCYSLATEGSIRGRGLLFGLEGGLFKLCLADGSWIGCCSVESDVAGDATGLGDTWSSFCCDGHTCSPMAEIWISAPQSEHLIEGRMLMGRSVSMAAAEASGRV